MARRLNTTAVAHPAKRHPHPPAPSSSSQTSRAKSVHDAYTVTVATIVVVVVCALRNRQRCRGNNARGNGAATERGPHPRRAKTPLRRHATRGERPREGSLARRLPAPRRRRSTDWPGGPGLGRSRIAAAAAPRPAPTRTGDRVPGIFSTARVPRPLRRRRSTTTLLLIYADGISYTAAAVRCTSYTHPPTTRPPARDASYSWLAYRRRAAAWLLAAGCCCCQRFRGSPFSPRPAIATTVHSCRVH